MSDEDSDESSTNGGIYQATCDPDMRTQQCYCLSSIGPHSYYKTKCCNHPMHRKCYFNLIDEGLAGNETAQVCPFCRNDDYVSKFAALDQIMNRTDPNKLIPLSAVPFYTKISAAVQSDTRPKNDWELNIYWQ